MSMLHHAHPSDEELGPSAKRRKVNTCLQCKSRKVKCDKVRPHCGPCQRRRIPVDECVFADEADPETLEHYLGPEYVVNQGFDMMDTAVEPPSLLGLDDPQARAVLDRITREMRLREAATEVNNGPSSDAAAALVDTASTGGAAILDAQIPQTVLTDTVAEDPKSASPPAPLHPSSQLPLAAKPTPETTKLILGLLPNDHVVNVLLDSLRLFESKSPLGISWRLIRIQLINLRGDISDWRTGQVQEPDVDLSFLALLFELMVSAIDCKPIEEIISEGIALTGDQVPEMTDRWHSTSIALLAMCKSDTKPNLNTVATTFLSYLYESRRGNMKEAIHHLQSSWRSGQAICMHRLDSATEDEKRWKRDSEEDDTMIRTGAVTAMRKALFEGGEPYALSEQKNLLRKLRDGQHSARSLARTNIPDRSHLVREAARTLSASLTWHLKFFTVLSPAAEHADTLLLSMELSSIDEAHLPDGETFDLPTTSGISSDTVFFFTTLLASVRCNVSTKLDQDVRSPRLLEALLAWDKLADRRTAQMREQVGAGRTIVNHFSLLVHHWTRIRFLRSRFGELEEDAALTEWRTSLVASCREALIQVQKLITVSDMELSIFQPLITLVNIDASLLLALHLLAQSRQADYNDSFDWHEVRSLVGTSLLHVWTQATETISARLGSSQSWRKPARQLVEQVLLEAFARKQAAMEQQPRVKIEDGAIPAISQNDRLDQQLGPLSDDDALLVYQQELLADDPIYKEPMFFETLDEYFWSL